jgi:uncharacterized membrane protein
MSLDHRTRTRTRPAQRVSSNLLIGGAIGTTGLLAGLYYSYAVSVMPGLHRASDQTMVQAMQEINRAIQNPVFFISFMGAPALSLWALIRARRGESNETLKWIIAGFALNALGLLITAGLNIPLNNQLDKAKNVATARHDFENPWIAWNIVRTLVTTAAFACLVRVPFLRSRQP